MPVVSAILEDQDQDPRMSITTSRAQPANPAIQGRIESGAMGGGIREAIAHRAPVVIQGSTALAALEDRQAIARRAPAALQGSTALAAPEHRQALARRARRALQGNTALAALAARPRALACRALAAQEVHIALAALARPRALACHALAAQEVNIALAALARLKVSAQSVQAAQTDSTTQDAADPSAVPAHHARRAAQDSIGWAVRIVTAGAAPLARQAHARLASTSWGVRTWSLEAVLTARWHCPHRWRLQYHQPPRLPTMSLSPLGVTHLRSVGTSHAPMARLYWATHHSLAASSLRGAQPAPFPWPTRLETGGMVPTGRVQVFPTSFTASHHRLQHPRRLNFLWRVIWLLLHPRRLLPLLHHQHHSVRLASISRDAVALTQEAAHLVRTVHPGSTATDAQQHLLEAVSPARPTRTRHHRGHTPLSASRVPAVDLV